MKNLKLIMGVFLLMVFHYSMNAQHDHGQHGHKEMNMTKKAAPGVTEIFMVYGNCNMCKDRIESSLKYVDGVNTANWDVDTKVMTVNYDNEITSLDKIKKQIAKAGHDTDTFKAEETAYNELPGCCQYERPKQMEKMNKMNKEDGHSGHKH